MILITQRQAIAKQVKLLGKYRQAAHRAAKRNNSHQTAFYGMLIRKCVENITRFKNLKLF